MVGQVGVYRKQNSLSLAGTKPKGKSAPSFENDNQQAEFDKFTGASYFDLTAIPISVNDDKTINIVVYGDPVRDGFDTQVLRNVTVSPSLVPGSFTPSAQATTPAAPAPAPASVTYSSTEEA